jgi:HSP20 family molecular chaperone IbpA
MRSLTSEDGAAVRRYEYDDTAVVVADIGAAREAAVDVVEETAIVVVGDDAGGVEREVALPPGDASARVNNGVVTVEVQR